MVRGAFVFHHGRVPQPKTYPPKVVKASDYFGTSLRLYGASSNRDANGTAPDRVKSGLCQCRCDGGNCPGARPSLRFDQSRPLAINTEIIPAAIRIRLGQNVKNASIPRPTGLLSVIQPTS